MVCSFRDAHSEAAAGSAVGVSFHGYAAMVQDDKLSYQMKSYAATCYHGWVVVLNLIKTVEDAVAFFRCNACSVVVYRNFIMIAKAS